MLDINKIVQAQTDSAEFWGVRKGRLTSSKIYCICAPKGIGEGGLTYIRTKAAERMNDKSYDRDIMTEAIAEGNANEPKSRIEFGLKHKKNYVGIFHDKCIVYDDMFSSTPDALLVVKEFKETFDCHTWETKCYQVANHIKHCEAITPQDIKEINPQLYWQVISQIEFSGCTVGWATFFNPDFTEESGYRMHSVQFYKKTLIEDFKLLRTRMEEARVIYNKIISHLK